MPSSNPQTQRRFLRKPVAWLAVTLTALVLLLGGWASRELLSKKELVRQVDQLRAKGLPVDDQSLEIHFVSTTSTEHSVEWRRLSDVFSSSWTYSLAADLPHFGKGLTPGSALAGQSWPQGIQVAEFLDELGPYIDRLHAVAEKTKKPVWHPIHFEAFATLLGPAQESRAFSRVLGLDFDYALFDKDSQRALRDLRSMQSTAEAYHWDTFVVCELIYQVHLHLFYQAINRGMQSTIWNAEELKQMRSLIGETQAWEDRWVKLQQKELAMALAWLDTDDPSAAFTDPVVDWTAKLPSAKLRFLDESLQSQTVGSGGLLQIARQGYEKDLSDYKQSYGLLYQTIWPSRAALARAMLNVEEARRLAHTVVAVKQYKLMRGKLPESLQDLVEDAELKLAGSCIQGVDQSPLGYQVIGDTAWVWNTRSIEQSSPPIMTKLPTHDPNTGESQASYGRVVKIH